MDKIKKIQISDYSYHLPDERIAKYPLPQRDKSKLLIYKDDTIEETVFENICNYIDNESLIVFNNTRVIQARMLFNKTTGAKIEIFCLEPHSPKDFYQAFQQTHKCQWQCIVGNLKKWKNEELIKKVTVKEIEIELKAVLIQNITSYQIIEFSWENNEISFGDVLEYTGNTPIPPYLNRDAQLSDKERYQTIYSKTNGSVAAPTAGLHFTENVFNLLKNNNIQITELTLHVGAGTFKPVKSEYIVDHEMHTEHFFISLQTLQLILDKIDSIVAVGTTSLRTLESLYWIGNKIVNEQKEIDSIHVSQWEPYNTMNQVDTKTAIESIIKYLQINKLQQLSASTQIMVVPTYQFRLVNKLITNFHQPQSTLLLLVSAFIGENWKNVYEYAMNNSFRFLSYGDSSILSRKR